MTTDQNNPDHPITVPELQFQDVIENLINKTMCAQYMLSAHFEEDKKAALDKIFFTREDINAYITNAVNSGVPIESACICISLFIQLKLK